jgi:NitT/TauT family transport system ATP-binding protein
VPTSYPKCSPSEVQGLLVLLNSHAGAEDVALLADDLDLEIDEILPAVEFAEVLQMVTVQDGRATLTDTGKRFLAASINERKAILRDQLRRTTLFRTLLRALEGSPTHALTDDQLTQIVSVTAASTDEAIQNIVNWGRHAGLFRYDSGAHLLVATPRASARPGGGSRPPPPSSPASPPPPRSAPKQPRTPTEVENRASPVAVALV